MILTTLGLLITVAALLMRVQRLSERVAALERKPELAADKRLGIDK